MSTTWTNELELTLIECYQSEPILWQAKHKDHKNKNKVHDAWTRISGTMNIPVAELKKKKESLMSSYRTYRKKVKDSTHSGAGSNEIYKPIWFAYETMDAFLGEGNQCKKTINTEESLSMNTNEEEEEESLSSNVEPWRPPTVRRRKNCNEIFAAGETVKDALSTLKESINSRRIQDDDECDLHGKIIAKKLRKLPDDERTQFVCEIYNMFLRYEHTPAPTYSYNQRHSQTRAYSEPSTSYQRVESSHSNYSEPPIYYSPPQEIHILDQTPTPASRIIITSNKCVQPATQESTNYDQNVIDDAFNNA